MGEPKVVDVRSEKDFAPIFSKIEVKIPFGRRLNIERDLDPITDDGIMRFAPVLGPEGTRWVLNYARQRIGHAVQCAFVTRALVDTLVKMGADREEAETWSGDLEGVVFELFHQFKSLEDMDAHIKEHDRVTDGLGFNASEAIDQAIWKLAERAADIARAPLPEPSEDEQA